ncbi:MAG: dicarboxylate/amino acid:cation symporter [Marinilabiliales bacterium]
MKKIPLYLKILIGMLLGALWGIAAVYFNFIDFTIDWVKPFGTIFLNLLKLIAVPLIFVSLVKGVGSLQNISKLSRIGIKTIGFYIISTVIAVSIGLVIVNTMKPGKIISKEIQNDLLSEYKGVSIEQAASAKKEKERGPLRFLVDLIPENIVKSASENKNMLQVIFFSLLIGISMVLLNNNKIKIVRDFFDGFNDIILKIIDIIMLYAPIGVLALFAGTIVEIAGNNPGKTVELFSALGLYSLTVITGLLIMIIIIYPVLIYIFSRIPYFKFLKGIFPAQMLAFTTSSSAATLPVTMECCKDNLEIEDDVVSFVLPVGATINMDGTSLYQAVAAVFIAQALGIDLTLTQQLTIVLTATLASIGSAAVPGAGIIMLIIVLESIGVPSEGIGLIIAVDRPLDMLRTTVNVTGDSTVATIINSMEKRTANT